MIEVRPASAVDWGAIGALADSSVRHVSRAGPQTEWLGNRMTFSGRRWHFVAEQSGEIIGYGALEVAATNAGASVRQFLVIPWDRGTSSGAADALLDQLSDVVRAERLGDVYMREYAEDDPLLDHLVARGYSLGRRYIWNDIALVDLRSPNPQQSQKVIRTTRVSDAVWQMLGVTSGDVFGLAPLNLEWRRKDDHFVLYKGAAALAHVGVVHGVTVAVANLSFSVAGVGGVVTSQDQQRKGLARRLLDHVISILSSESSSDFAMLFCLDRLVPYYRALGWTLICDSVEVMQREGFVECPLNSMVLSLRDRAWPTGRVVVQELPF